MSGAAQYPPPTHASRIIAVIASSLFLIISKVPVTFYPILSVIPAIRKRESIHSVIPAKAGNQVSCYWTPAFAGVTVLLLHRPSTDAARYHPAVGVHKLQRYAGVNRAGGVA